MKLNKYTRIARLYPTAIVFIPISIFLVYVVNTTIESIISNSIYLKLVGNISLSVVILYFLSQVIRFIGKEVFEHNIFKNELEMPTTNFLMPSDINFSAAYKNRLFAQINTDFQITINTNQDELSIRREIKDAVGLIRNKVKNGNLLLQYNIEYGFVRNLIGGSPLALIFCLLNLFFYFENKPVFILNIILAAIFLFLVFVSRFLIKRYGNLYAKRLFYEYLTP